MEQIDIIKLFRIIDIDYPSNQIAKDPDDRAIFVARWMQRLGSQDRNAVFAAYEIFTTRSPRFAPSWQDIVQIIGEMTTSGGISADEAWGKILEAVKRFGREGWRAKEFLGPDIWTIVDRFKYQTYCDMDEGDGRAFSQFRDAYNIYKKRAAEMAVLPAGVLKIIDQISSGMGQKQISGGVTHEE